MCIHVWWINLLLLNVKKYSFFLLLSFFVFLLDCFMFMIVFSVRFYMVFIMAFLSFLTHISCCCGVYSNLIYVSRFLFILSFLLFLFILITPAFTLGLFCSIKFVIFSRVLSISILCPSFLSFRIDIGWSDQYFSLLSLMGNTSASLNEK